MYSVKNLIKVMSYFATAVIFITAVSLFAMQGDDGRAYAADAVASISVTPIRSVLDVWTGALSTVMTTARVNTVR